MYDLKIMNRLTLEYENKLIDHFKKFFSELIKEDKVVIKGTKIKLVKLEKYDDVGQLKNNLRFYVILTDYRLSSNTCTCSYKSEDNKCVKAIYIGVAYSRKERIIGHLFNEKYKGKDTKLIKIDGYN